MKINRSLGGSVIILILIFTSLYTIVNIVTDIHRPSCYRFLWLLPLSFLFVSIYFIARWYNLLFSSITGTIVVFTYFARMVIAPLFMSMGNYEAVMDDIVYDLNANFAILLMVYETLVIFLVLIAFIQKSGMLSDMMEYPEEGILTESVSKPSGPLWGIIAGMGTFIIGLIILDNTIWKANFLLLVDINQTYHAYSSSDTGIGTLSMYVELMNSMYKLIQVILPPMLLYYVARRKNNPLKYSIAFLIFLAVVIIATDDRIDAIFAGIAFLFTVRDTFEKNFRHKFKQWMLIIVFAGLFGLSIKSGVISSGTSDADMGNMSKMLVAYFSGVPTVSAGIGMSDTLEGLNLFHIFPDSVSKIPYLTYVVKLLTGITITNSNQLLNYYISGIVGRSFGQILPSIAVGYEYFGFIFAPVLPALFLKLALYFERNIKMQNDIVRRNLYYWITICVASSPIISSVLLITAKISWFAIAMIMMAVLKKRKEKYL